MQGIIPDAFNKIEGKMKIGKLSYRQTHLEDETSYQCIAWLEIIYRIIAKNIDGYKLGTIFFDNRKVLRTLKIARKYNFRKRKNFMTVHIQPISFLKDICTDISKEKLHYLINLNLNGKH